jgi:hypothetical protein
MLSLIDLLGKGFFPRELPPAFSTTAFATAVTGSKRGLAADMAGDPKHSKLCVHNMVRSGGLRRHLGLANPVHYARLCEFVVQNWTRLQKSAHRSPFSLTQPVDTSPERAIAREHDLSVRATKRVELRARSRFILRTDINRFYPSIYTHALPWAIEGKNTVKQAMAARNLNAIWSNDLDLYSRNLNDQQTVGVPIGPDTSVLMAEIVLAAVDEELAQEIPGLRGIRFVDDYEFVVNQRSEAEHVANVLQSILSKYELALSQWKTRVIELPDTIEPLWTSRLSTFLFRDAGPKGQRNDLTAYFDNIFVLGRAEPDEDIFKYAIPRLNSVDIEEANWPILQGLLSQCALVEPACLQQISEQVSYYKSLDRPISSTLWTACLNQIITERLPIGQASEALWALWLLKQLGLHMSASAEQVVDKCEDSAVALMALGMASVGLANSSSFTRLHSFAEPSELFSRQWLLCYEGNKQGWLTPPSKIDALSVYPQFDFLRQKDVSFFNINAPAATPRRLADGLGDGSEGYPM